MRTIRHWIQRFGRPYWKLAGPVVDWSTSTGLWPIDDVTYGDLERHFEKEKIIDICLAAGLSNMINRFLATFQTDIDDTTLAKVEVGTAEGTSYPINLPPRPGKNPDKFGKSEDSRWQ